jgi:hypothetical protein
MPFGLFSPPIATPESQEARQIKLLSKGDLAKDLEVESDGEDIV